MFHVITGGSGSGKSAYAEECAVRYHSEISDDKEKLCYIATMEPFGKETFLKIERHRRMREGKGFESIECYTDLLENEIIFSGRYTSTLLECMSNLVANEFYKRVMENAGEKSPGILEEETIGSIKTGISRLCEKYVNIVIVTNEVCSEYADISDEMKSYKRILSEINRWMAANADIVTEVIYGIPVRIR